MVNSQQLLGALLGTGFGGRNRRLGALGGGLGGLGNLGLGGLGGALGGLGGGGLGGGLGAGLGGGTMGNLAKAGAVAALASLALQAFGRRDDAARRPQSSSQQSSPQQPPPAPHDRAAPDARPLPPGAIGGHGASSAGAPPINDSHALLLVRAMIAAANADGSIDEAERSRILAKLDEAGAGPEERDFVDRELRAPTGLDALLRSVDTPELGVQVYMASLLAISADTAAEQSYLRYLADRLKLPPETVDGLHRALGVGAAPA